MLSREEMKLIINSNYTRYGKNVYLLGTASFGPTNCPIQITSISHLYSIFGSKGSLINAYKQIYNLVSDLNIFCCKITGSHAVTFLNVNIENDDVFENGLEIKSIYSSDIYNNVKIDLYNDNITFTFPDELSISSIRYNFEDFYTLGALIDQINKDTENGLNCVECQLYCDTDIEIYGALSTVNPGTLYLFGGNNGLNASKNTLYCCLQDTLELLRGQYIDFIVPLDMYIDDIEIEDDGEYSIDEYSKCCYTNLKDKLKKMSGKKVSYYDLLLSFCIQQLHEGMLTMGIMGYNPTSDMYLNNSKDLYVDTAIKYLNQNKINPLYSSYYQLISVVVGDIIVEHLSKNVNGYIVYAIECANIGLMDCPTNKVIADNIFLYNEFDNKDLAKFADNGLVALRFSPYYENVVFSSCVTSCDKDNLMHNMQNLKAIQFSVSCIYDIFQEYVGEDLDMLLTENMLTNIIKNCLTLIKEQCLIDKFKFTLIRETEHNIKIYLYLKTKQMADYFKAIHKISIRE